MFNIRAAFYIGVLSCLLISCSTIPKIPPINSSTMEQSALNIVTERNKSYNEHDLEAFLATYDENVKIYTYPDELMGEGVERLRRIFGEQFSEKDGEIQVHSQYAVGNVVVNNATESFFGITQHVIAIYTIENGLIKDLRLIETKKE